MKNEQYSRLQAATLGAAGSEEHVTVNQRALIDKILSRYATANSALRELLQNADDAQATRVEIHYGTDSGTEMEARDELLQHVPDLNVTHLLVKNNGAAFCEADWSRLKRIAEGNPDEEKIGAFGVGFFSVFSACEEPFVSSGTQAMAFYWKKDQLFVRRADLEIVEPKTTFYLPNRVPSPVPNLPKLAEFLSNTLTFTRNLQQIELFFDRLSLLRLTRSTSPPSPVAIPSNVSIISPQKLFSIQALQSQLVQISAQYLGVVLRNPDCTKARFFSAQFIRNLVSLTSSEKTPIPLSQQLEHSATFEIITADVKTMVKRSLSAEIERAQKKPIPKRTSIFLLFNTFDSSVTQTQDPVLQGLLPSGQGKIFIGFPTHQTTGFNAHIGAPGLIPTVERESIDLADPFIKQWNIDLLFIIGSTIQCIYSHNMKLLAERFKHSTFSELQVDAIHIYKQFIFSQSTPSTLVSQIFEDAFFSSPKDGTIPLLTSVGVFPSHKIKIPNNDLSFLETVPFLPPGTTMNVPTFVKKAKEYAKLSDINYTDILQELTNRPLSMSQVEPFLKWLITCQPTLPDNIFSKLKSTVMLPGPEGNLIAFGMYIYYLNAKIIPPTMPVPVHCLPAFLSSSFQKTELEVLGLKQLSVKVWIMFLTEKSRLDQFAITKNADFADEVLRILSKQWYNLCQQERTDIASMLCNIECIPTISHGIQKPSAVYFQTVKLFPDLPRVKFINNIKENFLMELGVRKIVDLSLVFSRLVKGGQWSHYELINFLYSVKDDILSKDFERLKRTPLCPAIGKHQDERYVLSSLYYPDPALEFLGLPVLDWPSKQLRIQQNLTEFLLLLGLKRYPQPDILLSTALQTGGDAPRKAIEYLLGNWIQNEYDKTYSAQNIGIKFLPAYSPDSTLIFCKPNECFVEPGLKHLGYSLLEPALVNDAAKLGVEFHPSTEQLVYALSNNPPKDPILAVEIFSMMAKFTSKITKEQFTLLGSQYIVPVSKNQSSGQISYSMVQPINCFFRTEQFSDDLEFYQAIFYLVDFGQNSNLFLRLCGAQEEPSLDRILEMLLDDPFRIYTLTGSRDSYLTLLNKLALQSPHFQRNKQMWSKMKSQPFLLAYTYSNDIADDARDDTVQKDSSSETFAKLTYASNIIIADDFSAFQNFRNKVLIAPNDNILERFYRSLGSHLISETVQSYSTASGISSTYSPREEQLARDVVERWSVFLSEPQKNVKYHSEWLCKHLIVRSAEVIMQERRLVLKEVIAKHRQHVTALAELKPTPQNPKNLVLYVTKDYSTWDISNSLCSVLLSKHRLNDVTLLNTLIATDVPTLEKMGYNVKRILREYQTKTQLSEDESIVFEKAPKLLSRPASLDSKENKKLLNNEIDTITHSQFEKSSTSVPHNSGGKHLISQAHPPDVNNRLASDFQGAYLMQGVRGMWEKLLRHDHSQSLLASRDKNGTLLGQKTKITKQNMNNKPSESWESKEQVDEALQAAIKMARPNDSSSLCSSPMSVNIAEEQQKLYCDNTKWVNLRQTGTIHGFSIYCDPKHAEFATMIGLYKESVRRFGNILERLAVRVFGVDPSVFHIFYETDGRTIAFNHSGAIFCNLKQVPYPCVCISLTDGSFYNNLHTSLAGDSSEPMIYWFVTICHELAHNLVSVHTAAHSFYAESFVERYLCKLIDII